MKTLFLVYTADHNLMNNSKELVGIFTTKDKAIEACEPFLIASSKKHFQDNGYETYVAQLNDVTYNLMYINQTQSFPTNLMIEEMQVNIPLSI